MDFLEIANARQSCRSYDSRPVEDEKLNAVLEAARLAPSACNAQPYHFTVCRGQAAKAVVAGVTGMGMNKFTAQAPVLIVISERSYNKTAADSLDIKRLLWIWLDFFSQFTDKCHEVIVVKIIFFCPHLRIKLFFSKDPTLVGRQK